MDALDLLVRKYASLAGYLARRALAKAPPHQDREDILSYAQHGLLDAIEKFNPDQGVKFETYATRRITGAIIDGQRSQDPLSRSARKQVKDVAAASDAIWEATSQEPSLEQIAEKTGMTLDEVRNTLLAQKSLNASLDDASAQFESSGVHSDAETSMELADLRSEVAHRLAKMQGRAKAFLLVHYCDERNMKDTAEELSIGASWCRNARSQLIDGLRG